MKSFYMLFTGNWRFSILLTVVTVFIGILSILMLNSETLPPVNFATVTVRTIYPGASSEEVHDRVTVPLEEELQGISGIKSIRSKSANESSEIIIRIDIDNGDPEAVVNEIQRAVSRGSALLPDEILTPPIVTEVKARELPVMEMALVGPNDERKRDRLADRLSEILRDIDGVSRVSLVGYRDRELQVLLNRKKLSEYQIGPGEVARAISSHILNIPAGYIENGSTQKLVRVIGKVSRPDEVSGIIIRANDVGNAVKIGNVGRVVDYSADERLIARLNGREATLLIAAKNEDADSIEVTGKLRTAVDEFKRTLPTGYELEVYRDESVKISERLGIVSFNAIAGLIAVLVMLFIFLPGRIGIASATSLLVSTLGTLSVMVLLGANFNVITMIALVICIGNLVDNSVVITEYYARLREKGVTGPTAAIEAAQQFAAPFLASTITIIAAFLPMLVTKGVLGQFIQWIPIVVMIALTFALVESLTLLPARLQFFTPKFILLKKKNVKEKGHWFPEFEAAFSKFIAYMLRKRRTAYLVLTALIASALTVTILFNRFELFPPEGVEYYVVRFETPAGSTLRNTDAAGVKMTEEVTRAFGRETIASVVSQAGSQSLGIGDIQGKNGDSAGFVLVQIKSELAPKQNVNEMLAKLRAIKTPDGIASVVYSSVQGGPPVGKPLTVTLRSSDVNELTAISQSLTGYISKLPGVSNAETDVEPGGREHRVAVNSLRAAMGQTSISGIGNQLRIALQGMPAATLNDAGTDYNVVVRFDKPDKSDWASFSRTDILIARDLLTPLSKIASFTEGESPSTIKSYNHMRSITVTADADTKIISSARLNMTARDFVEKEMKKYPSVTAEYGGEEEATRESLQSLGIAMLLAILGIFATLVFMFRSFTKPFLILSTIPLGIIGVLYAFAITGRPLSFMAFIGIIGLSGVVINSAIILLDYIEEIRREKPKLDLNLLLVAASTGRLRAVLVTGLTTVVGLLPTAFGLGGYDPILAPLTLALSWGMIVGTLLSLIWLPTGYLIFERIGIRMRGLFNRG